MGLLEKLRDIRSQPADGDLLAYLGVASPDQLQFDKDGLTVGGVTLPMREVRLAMNGGRIPQTPEPRRNILIGDL